MKSIRILSLMIAFLVAPFMMASAPSDIEQPYKAEKAKVEKKVKQEKPVKAKKAKAQEAKKKAPKAKAEKVTKPTKVAKTPKTTQTIKTPKAVKTPKTAKVEKVAKTPKTEKVTKTTKLRKNPKATAAAITAVKATHRGTDTKELLARTVILGEEFTVARPASPNFGRTWKLHKALPSQIEQVGKEKFIPAEHPGKNEGTLVFTFKAVKPGSTRIEFEKVYPADIQAQKPFKVRILPVEIKGK